MPFHTREPYIYNIYYVYLHTYHIYTHTRIACIHTALELTIVLDVISFLLESHSHATCR